MHDHDYILSLSPELSKIPEKGDYTPMPHVRHPLVRIHPVTQRKSLFISPHTMVGIEGMSEKDGRGLLGELIEHATQEKFVYKHQWQNDDIVMWDNRCTMHCVNSMTTPQPGGSCIGSPLWERKNPFQGEWSKSIYSSTSLNFLVVLINQLFVRLVIVGMKPPLFMQFNGHVVLKTNFFKPVKNILGTFCFPMTE